MKPQSFKLRFLPLVVAALCACGAGGTLAQIAAGALPTGGTVVGGAASIVQNGTTLNIHQTSNQALVQFSTFNVGASALVDIRQPGAAAALLARVTGGDPSQIYGQIRANGALWLINPSGILVGQGARIDVGSFVASTLGVTDADFLAGRLTFTSPASGLAGAVRNAGTVNAASGGRIYLVAPTVENAGMLNAPQGEVILAAAQNVQLIDTGHPGVSVALGDAKGDVQNIGRIVAEAGRIGLAAGLVSNAGEISASSAVTEGGRVFLRATDLKTADTSRISADGTAGGSVELVADRATIDGRVSATGSAGPGGFVDTSGHASLNVKHAPTVGKGGTWLIDPSDLTVVAGGGGSDLNDFGVITSTEAGTTVGADVISALLDQDANVALVTGNNGTGQGNIRVSAAITKSVGDTARLTLRAHNNIEVNAPITSTSGVLDLSLKTNFYGNTTDPGHSATLNANVNLNGGVLDVSQGEALGNGILNIAGGTTTLTGQASIAAAAVNVGQGGRVAIDSIQTLQGAWTNAGEIELSDSGSLRLENPSASLVNNGRVVLSGTNFAALVGSTDVANLTNNGEIVKTSAGEQEISDLASGLNARLSVQAGQMTLNRSTLGGGATVAPASTLVLRDTNLAGGVDITGAGAMVWSGNVTLLGDVTLGATAPTLSDDPGRFFTFIRGSGYKLTSHSVVNVVKDLVLAGGTAWDNHGTVNVGPAGAAVLELDPITAFNIKAGGVLNVADKSRLQMTNGSVINNEQGGQLWVASAGTSAFSGGYQGAIHNSGTIVKTGVGSTPAPLTNLAGGVLRIEEGSFGVAFSETNANLGTIEIASGATLRSTNGTDLHNAGVIRGTGTVELVDETSRLVNNGLVAPGGSDQVGTLTVHGGYTQGALGALNVRLANAASDQLVVAGAVQLAGALNLSTLGGGMPAHGATADFLVASAGRTGTFSQVNTMPVVTPDTTVTLAVVYPASGNVVAQVKATTAPTAPVVVPPIIEPPVVIPPTVEPPVVVPPADELPAVVPPVSVTPTPTPTPAASADICTIAPHSALCLVLSPPRASEPLQPMQQASNEVIKLVNQSAPYALTQPPAISDLYNPLNQVFPLDGAAIALRAPIAETAGKPDSGGPAAYCN